MDSTGRARRRRTAPAHELAFRNGISNHENPTTIVRGGEREIRSAKAAEVQSVDVGEAVGLTLQQQPVVHQSPVQAFPEVRVRSGQHLVADPIEPDRLWQGEEPPKEDLLPEHNQDRRR